VLLCHRLQLPQLCLQRFAATLYLRSFALEFGQLNDLSQIGVQQPRLLPRTAGQTLLEG